MMLMIAIQTINFTNLSECLLERPELIKAPKQTDEWRRIVSLANRRRAARSACVPAPISAAFGLLAEKRIGALHVCWSAVENLMGK
jgi:hypothetical protein